MQSMLFRISACGLLLSSLLTGAALARPVDNRPFQVAANSYDDGEAIQARVIDFIEAWQNLDIKSVEFMLHNAYTSNSGENKAKYLARLRREAANSAGRQITYNWKGARMTGANRASATIQISYNEQFKQYQNSKYFSSCQMITLDLIKFSDGKWYLVHEKDVASACPQ